jgi:hypothetical protein
MRWLKLSAYLVVHLVDQIDQSINQYKTIQLNWRQKSKVANLPFSCISLSPLSYSYAFLNIYKTYPKWRKYNTKSQKNHKLSPIYIYTPDGLLQNESNIVFHPVQKIRSCVPVAQHLTTFRGTHSFRNEGSMQCPNSTHCHMLLHIIPAHCWLGDLCRALQVPQVLCSLMIYCGHKTWLSHCHNVPSFLVLTLTNKSNFILVTFKGKTK